MRRVLPVRLTEAAVATKARLAAALTEEAVRVDEERKRLDGEKKDEVRGLRERVTVLLREIKEGAERVEVEVDWRVDIRRNVKELVRFDTGEVVETEALTAEERQGELFVITGEGGEEGGQAVEQAG